MISKSKVLTWFFMYVFLWAWFYYNLISGDIFLIANVLLSLIIIFMYGKSAIIRTIIGLYFAIPGIIIMPIYMILWGFRDQAPTQIDQSNLDSFMMMGFFVISVILIGIIIKTIIVLAKKQGNIAVNIWILALSLLAGLIFYLLVFVPSAAAWVIYLNPIFWI